MPTDSGCTDEIEVLATWHEPDFAGHEWSYFDAPEELGQCGISVLRTIHPPMTSPPGLSHGVSWADLRLEDTPLWRRSSAQTGTPFDESGVLPAR
jgi:hypothetical protein